MNICTIIAKNYLAHARVLTKSFQAAHPGGRCFVLIIDEIDGYVDAEQEAFTLVRPSQIGLEAFDEMRGAYDVMELSTAVKPWLLRHMLRHHDDGSGVAYMDPDIRILSRMTELEDALAENALVLTPHVLKGMPRDGHKPSETDILMAGVYNLGFIGVSDRPDAHLFLDWWSERLLTDCHVAPERGLFVDQRWVDFLPGLVSDLEIFRNPTYNVAYWNLPERELQLAEDEYTVDGQPLRFFHFSGYSPDQPRLLSKHQNRVDVTASHALWTICSAYGEALRTAGLDAVRELPYEHDILPSGLRLTKIMRGLYRAGVESGDCPDSLFRAEGEAEFMAWLAEPSPEAPRLNRYLHALWTTRPDLQLAYPQINGPDLRGYLEWCATYGGVEVGVPAVLLPPERRDATPTAGPTPGRPSRDPEEDVRQPRPFGVNIAGYLRSELGIGEVARQLIGALDAVDVPVLPIGMHAPDSRSGHAFDAVRASANAFPINLICVNADGLPAFAREVGGHFFDGRYSVGLWWWETSEFPERHVESFGYLDEVWVGSHFVAAALARKSPITVTYAPVTVEFPEAAPLSPGELGWPDAFTFLFSFDFASVFERKNPLAVIDAYTTAFTPDERTALVVKCINPQFDLVNHRRLQEAVSAREDIVLMDHYLDAADKNRLMASCDCYVSLHRSEGFGLTIAEAMYMGKPVIATGYSGNMTYMNAHNSYPVRYALTPIGTGADPYPADGEWAQPDLAEAVRLLRHVRQDGADAAQKGAQGARDMREHHSPRAVGEVLKKRLERVASRVPAPIVESSAPDGPAALRRLVERGTRPAAPSRYAKPGAALRKLVLRVMKPYTAYQGQVNAALERELLAVSARAAAHVADTEARFAETVSAAMAETRRVRATAVNLYGQLSAHVDRGTTGLQRQLDHRLAPSERLVAETRAIPYMASEAFSVFDVGAAGSVFGYAEPRTSDREDAYREFEDLFRGSETFIADRQRRYLDVIGDCAPAVDVGCGRGEFLDLLTDAGIAVTGVDMDAGMVARCRAKGHADTVQADGIAYLEGRPDASLGLVFCAQVVEHMRPADLDRFLRVAAQKLRPGGLLVAETVNPHSAAALKAFWVDITHQHPLFPEPMLALCRISGFTAAYVFHPNGSGDVEADRYVTGEYAVVARR